MSDSDSDSSFDNISVCEEISQLIEQCQSIHTNIQNSVETLKNIESFVINHNNIIVTHNNLTEDFCELLKILHLNVLQDIENTNIHNFGQKLLEIIDNSCFH